MRKKVKKNPNVREEITFRKDDEGNTLLHFSTSGLTKTFDDEDKAKEFIREHRENPTLFKQTAMLGKQIKAI